MNAFKKQCIDLRKKDYTLTEIAKITGRPKNSVHFHIRNLPLSKEKLRVIRNAHAARARLIATRRRGVSARPFRRFTRWNISTVTFVAHFLFDGEVKKGGCYYHNRNESLIKKVELCVKELYDFEPKRYENRKTGVSRICYFNVAFAAYIKEKSDELLENVTSLPAHIRREFLRAFFDDEGCMDFRPARNLRRVRGYQKNTKTRRLVKELLLGFGIDAEVKYPNEVVITGKPNLIRFRNEINFSTGVRVNGKRSNSIWKKSLEKRELLDRAIASFKT